MVNFKKLTDQAKQLVDKRGGTEGLKKDASELMNIAKSKRSVGDKAKTAMDRLKRPAHEREGEGPAETRSEAAAGAEKPAATTGGSVTDTHSSGASEAAAPGGATPNQSTPEPGTGAGEMGAAAAEPSGLEPAEDEPEKRDPGQRPEAA